MPVYFCRITRFYNQKTTSQNNSTWTCTLANLARARCTWQRVVAPKGRGLLWTSLASWISPPALRTLPRAHRIKVNVMPPELGQQSSGDSSMKTPIQFLSSMIFTALRGTAVILTTNDSIQFKIAGEDNTRIYDLGPESDWRSWQLIAMLIT